jgi:uncharacterized protein
MERVVLGRTGLEVYRLGFGGIPIQRVTEQEAVATVLHAIETGVDFIDTARGYTTSERRIGTALKQTDKRVVLASKSMAKTAEAVRADLETSLKELQKDYVDIYQCHYVSTEADYQTVTGPGGALAGLTRAQEEGLIGHIGITSHDLRVLERAVADGLFETIMVCFSFLEPAAAEKVIPKAVAAGIGVLAMKPFSGGVIENATLALKYVLSVPGVVAIPGVETPELFDEDWGVFQGPSALSQEEEREIAALQQRYDKIFCRRCDYCQPCSQEIQISTLLGLESIAKRIGMEPLVSGMFRESIEQARNCSDCGECVQRCPYQLPVPELIRGSLGWFDARST